MLDLQRYVPALLTWVSSKLFSNTSHLYREKFGLGITDWRVLVFIEIFPWSTGAEVSAYTGLDKGAVSRSLAYLSDREWLKSKSDGLRKVKYSTSRLGKKLYQRILKTALAREQALLTGFSEQERELLINLLHRLLENLQEVDKVTT